MLERPYRYGRLKSKSLLQDLIYVDELWDILNRWISSAQDLVHFFASLKKRMGILQEEVKGKGQQTTGGFMPNGEIIQTVEITQQSKR
jgi:hypothetical protein